MAFSEIAEQSFTVIVPDAEPEQLLASVKV